jgi:cytoskeleton protein RodZ
MKDTIGQRLKKAREYRNLTLEKAAEATRIRRSYLQALEADDFSAMPSPVQARGFLRNYAQYLDLDLDQMVDELRVSQPTPESETEVVFEGEKTVPIPEKEENKPEDKAEEASTGTSVEPFWQTWLNRVKRETGETDKGPASQPEPKPAPVTKADSALGADIASKGDASQSPEQEAAGDIAESEVQPQPGMKFLDWARSHILRDQTDAALAPEIEDEPEPEPEPVIEADTQPRPEIPSEPGMSSQEIINEIGLQLRRRRELLSLTLDEIERHTRMRSEFMDALEKGKFDELPSPVQTRGMLANYASFLDLDVDALLLRFADALQARHRERHPEKTAERNGQPNIPENLPRLRSFIAGDLVFGIGMVLLLIIFSVWGISRVITLQSERQVEAAATGLSISEALIGTPVETIAAEITLIPAVDTPIASLPEGTVEIPTQAANVNVQVNIVAVERTYLRVTVDGEVVFDGRTIPGNAYPFEAEQTIEILAGSGAALRVVYNQRDLGLLGGFGQIASFIYTPNEILVPTPVVSPTATLTPYISPTPSITPSPTLTASPTFTPTKTPTSVSQ